MKVVFNGRTPVKQYFADKTRQRQKSKYVFMQKLTTSFTITKFQQFLKLLM